MDEYSSCDECRGKGYDYYQDDDSDWMSRSGDHIRPCYDCPLRNRSREKRENLDWGWE